MTRRLPPVSRWASASSLPLYELPAHAAGAIRKAVEGDLAPDGIVTVTRLQRLVGDEALRATVLALAALERRGIWPPWSPWRWRSRSASPS
jgi:hypothetical protein